jgi:hypothetical protein
MPTPTIPPCVEDAYEGRSILRRTETSQYAVRVLCPIRRVEPPRESSSRPTAPTARNIQVTKNTPELLKMSMSSQLVKLQRVSSIIGFAGGYQRYRRADTTPRQPERGPSDFSGVPTPVFISTGHYTLVRFPCRSPDAR